MPTPHFAREDFAFDREAGLSMCIGETAIITDGACERVNHVPRKPIVH